MKQSKLLVALLALTCTVGTPVAALADDMINLPPLQNQSLAPNATSIYQPDNVALRGRVSTVPKGTMLMIKLDTPVNSESSHMGEEITATLENDIFINESIAVPAGSEVQGQVASVTPATHMGKHGAVDVRFMSVKTPDGQLIPIRAHVVTTDQSGILKGDTYTKDVVKGVAIAAGGTGVGTLMGLSAGSLVGAAGAGALLGLGAGAVGGLSYALIRKGKNVTIPTGARMSITLDQPVSINL